MLINLRNALMTGKRLPYDAEVEYLQSSGTQYIEAPYTVNTATDKIRVMFQGLAIAKYKWFFGIYDDSGAIRLASGSGDGADRRTVAYGSNTNYVAESITYNGPHELVADSNGLSIDGTNQFSFASFASTSKFCLCTFGRDGAPASAYAGNVRIFAFQHSRNGVLISDFIPVRKGTVGYLYDRVSGKLFGNAGTGDFVLGPDVVPVEYIESHGTEWIDTGVVTTNATGLLARIAYTEINNGVAAGTMVSGNRFVAPYYTYNGKWYIGWGAKESNITASIPTTDVDIALNYLNSRSAAVDDITIADSLGSISGERPPLTVFRRNYSAAYGYYIGRVYRLKISEASDLVRSFRPVRVGNGSTWEGAMMDVLTRRIYRNDGTGAFAYGNDLKYPIPSE